MIDDDKITIASHTFKSVSHGRKELTGRAARTSRDHEEWFRRRLLAERIDDRDSEPKLRPIRMRRIFGDPEVAAACADRTQSRRMLQTAVGKFDGGSGRGEQRCVADCQPHHGREQRYQTVESVHQYPGDGQQQSIEAGGKSRTKPSSMSAHSRHSLLAVKCWRHGGSANRMRGR